MSDELKEPDGTPHKCPPEAVVCPHPDCEQTTANVLLEPDGTMLTQKIVEGRWAWHAPMPTRAVTVDPSVEIERLENWVDDLQSGMFINCVYCGHRYGPSNEVPASMADVLKAHVEQCPEHPMSALKAELEEVIADRDEEYRLRLCEVNDRHNDRRELIELLSNAAPLAWVANDDMDGAQAWEKRAANVIADFHGRPRWPRSGGPEWLTWEWGWEPLDCCLMAWGPGDDDVAHTILEASNVDKEMQKILLSDAFRQAVVAAYQDDP